MKFSALLNFQFSIRNFKLKIFLLTLLTTCYLLFATTPAVAQTNSSLTTSTNPDVPKNLHNWTQSVMIEVMSAMTCQLTGIDPVNPKQQCLGVDSQTGKIGFVQNSGGAIGMAGNLIAMTYTPAFHTGDYFGYLAQNFGIAKPAYAQARTGAGFDSLSPIINLWTAFRNLVYLLFVAVFVVVGFGIMLRINIDPRTVMAISNQLPKIIIAILLVTFSFAISGGLIDLMWTSIYITTNVITSVDGPDGKKLVSAEVAQKIVNSSNPLEAANIMGEKIAEDGGGSGLKTIGGLTRIADEPSSALANQVAPIFDNAPGKAAAGFIGFVVGTHLKQLAVAAKDATVGTAKGLLKIGAFIIGTIAAAPTGVAAPVVGATAASLVDSVANIIFGVSTATAAVFFQKDIIGFTVGLITFLIIAIALLWALLRLTFQLIIAYVTILIHTVFAPFWIIGGLFPGSPIGFGAWFREMLGSLSVFPVTIAMFLLGRVFMTVFAADSAKSQFAPPMTGNPNAGNFGAFIGLGIILLTPQVVTIMKELFKSPQFKQGGAIGQAVGFGLGAVNIPQHVQKLNMYGYYAGHMKSLPFGIGSLFGASGEEAARNKKS